MVRHCKPSLGRCKLFYSNRIFFSWIMWKQFLWSPILLLTNQPLEQCSWVHLRFVVLPQGPQQPQVCLSQELPSWSIPRVRHLLNAEKLLFFEFSWAFSVRWSSPGFSFSDLNLLLWLQAISVRAEDRKLLSTMLEYVLELCSWRH